jgi:predicted outer membrane protein
MMKSALLVSVFATGSMLAFGMAPSAFAQQANDPFAPIGGLVAAPVIAAGNIATAPLAATGLLAPGATAGQSSRTAAFVANALPNINFLNESSRMALNKSQSPAIRHFAHRQATIQTIAGNSMTAWANSAQAPVTGRSSFNGGPLMGAIALPGQLIGATGDALTGGLGASNAFDANSQAQDLSRLSALNGSAFDELYRSTQLDSLNQLAMLYTDYAAHGDDPGLRRLARAELPKIKREIAQISRI